MMEDQRETTMDKAEDEKKKKKIHGTLVKVTDENIEDVAKEIMEMIQKARRPKGH
jgi:hypothetical protein